MENELSPIDDLKRKLKGRDDGISRLFVQMIDLRKQVAELAIINSRLREQSIKLREALIRFGGCQFDCARLDEPGASECTCGYLWFLADKPFPENRGPSS